MISHLPDDPEIIKGKELYMDLLALLTISILMIPLAFGFGFILMAPLASVASGFVVVSYQFIRLLEYMFITPDKEEELISKAL